MIAENHSHCLSWERRLQIAIDAAEGQYIFPFEQMHPFKNTKKKSLFLKLKQTHP
jgi:hypothetical protein